MAGRTETPPTRTYERADAAEAFISRLVLENDTETLSRAQLLIECAFRTVAALPPDTPALQALRMLDPDILSLAGVLPMDAKGLADALGVASGRFLVAAIRRHHADVRLSRTSQA